MYNLLKNCQKFLLTTTLFSTVVAFPTFANDYHQIQYRGHNIPLCAADIKSEYRTAKTVTSKNFKSINESKILHCDARYITTSEIEPRDFIDIQLKAFAKKFRVASRVSKSNSNRILFSKWAKTNNVRFYGGFIIIDENHLIMFTSAAKDEAVALDAIVHMMENFR